MTYNHLQLFGSESQFRLLRLLVSLGFKFYEQAVHGFALLQDSIFRHMYASAEALLRSSVLVQAANPSLGSDEHSAVTTLSRMFFEHMHSAVSAYVHLFADAAQGVETEFGVYSEQISRGKAALPEVVMRLLVKWAKTQVEGFAVKLSQQVSGVTQLTRIY